MEFSLGYLVMLMFTLIMGTFSGIYRIRYVTKKRTLRNGAWGINLNTGDQSASVYERASVAIAGLFGLKKNEAIYFTTFRDEEGRPLSSDNDYFLEGRGFDARWWSITTYDKDHYLIPNKLDRLSYNGNNLEWDTDGKYRILLSKKPKKGNWLPVGETGNFSITLRLYNPGENIYKDPTKVKVPRIILKAE